MILEHELVPYHESSLPEGPYLVFAPHPDDETLGLGGTILTATDQNIPVHVVLITGGGQGGEPAVRAREARNAAGILKAEVSFWEMADRELTTTPIPIERIRECLTDMRPQTVFLPALQEFHPDHRAATDQIEGHLRALAYPGAIWLYEIGRQGEVNRLINVSGVIDRKIEAIRCYGSQLDQLDYENVTLSINKARAITLGPGATYAEGFWALEKWPATAMREDYLEHIRQYGL